MGFSWHEFYPMRNTEHHHESPSDFRLDDQVELAMRDEEQFWCEQYAVKAPAR